MRKRKRNRKWKENVSSEIATTQQVRPTVQYIFNANGGACVFVGAKIMQIRLIVQDLLHTRSVSGSAALIPVQYEFTPSKELQLFLYN